jgi:hypothetical protein
VRAPIRVEPQENNRFRFWAVAPEFAGRYLRVVTPLDKLAIHNDSWTDDSGRETELLSRH